MMQALLVRWHSRKDPLIDTLIAEAAALPEGRRRRWPEYDRELQRKASRRVLARKVQELRGALDDVRHEVVPLRRQG